MKVLIYKIKKLVCSWRHWVGCRLVFLPLLKTSLSTPSPPFPVCPLPPPPLPRLPLPPLSRLRGHGILFVRVLTLISGNKIHKASSPSCAHELCCKCWKCKDNGRTSESGREGTLCRRLLSWTILLIQPQMIRFCSSQREAPSRHPIYRLPLWLTLD